MRLSRLFVVVVLICGLAAPAFAEDKSAKEIMDEALETNSLGFQAGQASLQLIIEDKAGDRRVRKMEVKSKKIDEATRTRVELTDPKEIKGQAFLFAENDSGEDDVWMYVPAFKVTRRIEGSQKNGSFLGSHFTYADLESRDMKEATYERLDDSKIGKHPVYVIESTPKKSVDSDYARLVTYVRKSDFMPLKVKFYEDSDELAKTLFVEKLDETDGGDTYIEQMTLRPESGGFTTIKIDELDRGVEISDTIFTKGQLGK